MRIRWMAVVTTLAVAGTFGACASSDKSDAVSRQAQTTTSTTSPTPAGAVTEPTAPPGPTVHVDPAGDDHGDGSSGRPFQTIGAAIEKLGTGGGTVSLAAGDYPARQLSHDGGGPVEVTGPAAATPPNVTPPVARVVGDTVVTGDGLTINRIGFEGVIELRGVTGTRITNSEITSKETNCLAVRGSHDVSMTGSWVHDCRTGVAVSGRPENPASNVTIRGNRVERLSDNGLSFGVVNGLTIDRNLIREAVGGGQHYHNDLIQGQGSSTAVTITNNRLTDSERQFMIFQANTGPNSNFTIANNVALRCGGNGAQISGISGLKFVNNTFWFTGYSAVLLRGSEQTALTGAVVANNILSGLGVDGPQGVLIRRNLLQALPTGPSLATVMAPANQTIIQPHPSFADINRGDAHLRRTSPAHRHGNAKVSTRRDIDGVSRGSTPSIGAYQ